MRLVLSAFTLLFISYSANAQCPGGRCPGNTQSFRAAPVQTVASVPFQAANVAINGSFNTARNAARVPVRAARAVVSAPFIAHPVRTIFRRHR